VNRSGPIATAEKLLARGLSVFPVPRPRPGVPPGEPGDGKVPAIRWKELQNRLPTWGDIVRWFGREPVNIAAATGGGVSDVVVIDADAPEALRWCTQHLPYTPWQTQTARGFHLWYAHPGVSVRNRARLETRDGRLAIDVRGDGGYVIAPGSLHASGAVYEFAGDWTVPGTELPRFCPSWIQRPPRPALPRPDTPRPTGDLVERARRYLAAIPRPELGHGSDNATLYAACRLTRGFGLSPADAEALLWEWAGGRPGWTREWIARKVTHAERYGREPIGALR
jgi:bifunctional DNA primase/polymerase-like protein